MNNQIPVESILYSNYIKYDRLSEMVESTFKGSNATSINIFIDLYSLVKPLYKCDTFIRENGLVMSSSIINLCAHLRYFFRNRYNVESNIYLIYSTNTPEYNKMLWLGYNQNQENILKRESKNNDLIVQNIKVLETLVPYLPGIYLLSSDFESGVLIYDTICYNKSIGNKNPNIVISKDSYLFQLVGLSSDLFIFRPKKSNSNDVSYVVNKENLLSEWFISKNVAIPDYLGELDSRLCSLLMSLSRCPERSIKSLFSLPKASEIIYSGVERHQIVNAHNSNTEYIWNSLYRSEFDKFTLDLFDRRFKVIDILSQYFVFMNVDKSKKNFLDLIDPNTVKEINNRYFEQYPLDLDRL